MKAAVLTAYGPADSVTLSDLPDPVPGAGQMLVRIQAASMNPLDAKLRSGALKRVMPLRFPAVLGFDFSGTVEGMGTGVEGWSVGERVYGRTDAKTGGTHAELAVVGAGVVDRMPTGIDFPSAAALPLAGMTALQALEQLGVGTGERVLVIGAAGGVGSLAIQIARAAGASVTGVCSAAAAPLVEGLGASVLDYTKGELATTRDRFDAVLDTVANAPTDDTLRVMTNSARYVTTGFAVGILLRKTFGRLVSRRRFGFVMSRADGALMRRMTALVASTRLRPVVSQTFPLAKVAEAHAAMERGHVRGKIVVTMS